MVCAARPSLLIGCNVFIACCRCCRCLRWATSNKFGIAVHHSVHKHPTFLTWCTNDSDVHLPRIKLPMEISEFIKYRISIQLTSTSAIRCVAVVVDFCCYSAAVVQLPGVIRMLWEIGVWIISKKFCTNNRTREPQHTLSHAPLTHQPKFTEWNYYSFLSSSFSLRFFGNLHWFWWWVSPTHALLAHPHNPHNWISIFFSRFPNHILALSTREIHIEW